MKTVTEQSTLAERSGSAFACGDLQIDVGRQRVLQDGKEIALPKLSFNLLVALVRAAPNILSSDALIERIWDGVIVNTETVIQRVKLLRDALGDDSHAPRYVGSLRGRGYFLIPSVVEEPTSKIEAPPPSAATAPPLGPANQDQAGAPRSAWRKPLVIATAVSAIGLIGWAVVDFRRSAVDREVEARSSAVAISPAKDVGRTIAVMPFRNLSRDPNDAFLATGMPEMILNRLSKVRNLAVVARSSSFALDPGTGDAHEIGRRLNSGHLVEGNVQRDGDHVRVTAQLIDTVSGTLVWSESFDRRVRDIFAIQDDISNQITAVLTARINGLEVTYAPQEQSANVNAHLSYFHGLSLLGRLTIAESEAAVPQFEKAIALDPGFAAAYAALYDAHMQAASRRREDMTAAGARWQSLIDKALELNPRSGTAHFARAMWSEGPTRQREADFRLGLELDPSNGRGITAYSKFIWDDEQSDRIAEARSMLQRALWIDPLSASARWLMVMEDIGRVDQENRERQLLQVLEIDPNFLPALQRYGLYRWLFHGQMAEAIPILEHAIAIDPQNPTTRLTATAVYLDLGDEAAARDVAAGAPASEHGAMHLLDLYRGDWRRAGMEAYASPTWNYTTLQNWGASEAVHGYALRTHEIDRAVQFIARQYGLDLGPKLSIELGNFRQAAMIADLYQAQSRNVDAERLRKAAAEWNDANEAMFGTVYAKRLRARLWLIAGNRDAALQELADSFRAGDYELWWYTFERDPTWEPVRKDPRFRALENQVHQYVAKQRASIDEMRHRGEIPRRGG